MSLYANKFDKFLNSGTDKSFDVDLFDDEERVVHPSEVVDVGRGRLRTSAELIGQSSKYKGKKINRKDIFDIDDQDVKTTNKTKRETRLMKGIENSKNDIEQKKIVGDSDSDDDESDLDEEKYDSDDDFNENEDELEDSDSNESEDISSKHKNEKEKIVNNNKNESSSGEEVESDVENDEEDSFPKDQMKTPQVFNDGNAEAISQQHSSIDTLMDIRLLQQEALFKANQLPRHQSYKHFKKICGKEFNDIVMKVTSHLNELMESVMVFEEYTLKDLGINKKTNEKMNLGDDDDAEITSEEDDDLSDGVKVKKMSLENENDSEEIDDKDDEGGSSDKNNPLNKEEMNKNLKQKENKLQGYDKQFDAFRSKYLGSLSDKWKFASHGDNKDFSSFYIPLSKQISQILQDKTRLLERTRVKRSVYDVLGEEKLDQEHFKEDHKKLLENDVEVFDDGDFYQKLLMDKTKRRTSSTTDMTFISKQWAELERLKKAVKKNVDQKATKGRKTRYEVHKKMLGFLAPSKPKNQATDDQIDAFYEHLSSVHNTRTNKST